ncbi:MAG: hypothetical protein V7K64_16880 [Nostoc sp.]|nr:hypothetical protein [Nostoc sp. JL34]
MTFCTLSYQVVAIDENFLRGDVKGGLRQRQIFNSHSPISAVIPE